MALSKASILSFALKLAGKLSLRAAQTIGSLLGWLAWRLATNSKDATRINLGIAFPETSIAERERLARASLNHTCQTLMEIPLMWEWPVAKCLELVKEIEGEHLLDEALADGRGLILLAPHLGNWELAGLYFSSRYKMAALYSPPKLKEFEDYMIRVRSRVGSELVRGDRRGLARLIGLLREGNVAGILPDQSPRGRGNVHAPFFGMAVRTMTLVSKLCQKSGATALMTYAERLPHGKGYRIVIRPCEPDVTAADPLTAATALNRSIEACIREIPVQYQWEYKRFRHRPAGEINPYYPDRLCK